MSESWNTKYGPRRVRRDPPTLAEAIAAAQGLTGDREQQVELAAGLMGVSPVEVRAEMKRLGVDRATVTTVAPSRETGTSRTVIVERKASRRIAVHPGRPLLNRPAASLRTR